ncbi:hypothetical protein APY04_0275 [Hyphomicrobium sulfonivorans]|uniref:Uncharacterized protein n=1 Tax=Hyphomicrobium sulfonivorans TaxID=121290 RepID=A0A109BNF0_HYPSL|nr:hypothetical protein [Hyphomicrobium sulfonivorans]KWT71992.1 hypothetical protein APY04_0275 [Hyphomicrobium sulfonivorans]
MRYVIAMVFAFIGAVLAAMFLSSPAADWVTAHQSFDSSDDAENLHMLVFIVANMAGLVIGWTVGWIVSGLGRRGTTAADQ